VIKRLVSRSKRREREAEKREETVHAAFVREMARLGHFEVLDDLDLAVIVFNRWLRQAGRDER
jgi:hypothetical protein